ncbi:DUF3168 domain-containing protein [Roseovarius sp.]|uniref:DUF3168 domain-containing protein n=1 Tax=Roseovarius sp. TaxID=1486281 RepID=UPI0026118CEE|nr:DUF3168 domain-containing protein [Roseovarius sp.]MDM8165348.1 DUF3168 domain-containing protein [Roseovarius sp.]
MSYGMAAALQEAVFERLSEDAAVAALVGGAVYDALPSGTVPALYVVLGSEDARARADGSGQGAWHRFTVSVVSDGTGFHAAKQVATAVSDALVDAEMSLSRGRLVALHFWRARARREGSGNLRRIDLTFRARVEET